MAYQTIPPSSSGGADPASVALRRARSLLGTTINKVIGDDFGNDQWYRTAGIAGSGAATHTTTKRGGVLVVTSGATANSTISVLPHGTTVVEVGNPQTDLWYSCMRLILTTAVDAQTSLQFRMATAAVSNPQSILGLTGSVSAAFFSWFTTTNAGAATSAATATAVDLNVYHLFETYGNATSIFFAIDGVQVASTLVANIGTNSITPVIQVGNGTTATARTIEVDYVYTCVADPTA